MQIVDQYKAKYSKDLSGIKKVNKPFITFKDQLTLNIVSIYQRINQ